MASITVEVTDDDLASLRDMATAVGPRGSGPSRRYATVEELAADLLAYLADDWRRMSGNGDRRSRPVPRPGEAASMDDGAGRIMNGGRRDPGPGDVPV